MRWFVVALVVLAIAVDLLAGVTGSSLTFLAGMGLVYAGERLFAEDALHWAFTGGGVLVVLLALGIRVRRMLASEGARKEAEQRALIFGGIAASSLLFYFLSTDLVIGALGLQEEAADRWSVTWKAVFPIVLLVGAIPMVVLDRALAQHPILLPIGASRRAMEVGLASALGLSLVFPINYLAASHKMEWDYAYFKVTKPGTSTLALVRGLTAPVEAYLFFSPGSDVAREIEAYFDELSAEAGGNFTVHYVDQAVEPKLSEELKVRENGYIAFKQGEAVEKFKVGTDLDKARRELKKLDQTVQKHLLEIASGARTAYLMVGHGEASSREKDDPLKKLSLFKQLLESQNYKIKNLGVAEGSSDAVPDDAAMVLIAAPEQPLLPEEVRALKDYVGRGGRLLVMTEPDGEPMDDLLGHIGLKADTAPLANAKYHVAQTRGPADRVLLATNRFGSHAAVSTLSKNSTQAYLVMPTVAAIREVEGGQGKTTVLVRTPENTWVDADGDRQQGADEKGEVHNVGYAASGGEGDAEWRAIVLGDVSVFSDVAFASSKGNQQLALDGVRWLVGDEDIAGSVESEEDVKIEHTREQDTAWFYGTIVGVPLFVLALGLVLTTTRRRTR